MVATTILCLQLVNRIWESMFVLTMDVKGGLGVFSGWERLYFGSLVSSRGSMKLPKAYLVENVMFLV